MVGQTISHYSILEKLGEGGMGVVYKARDTRLDRIVALKFLPERVNTNETEKVRFLQEAKAAAALNHSHICTVHGVEESGATLFIVMEHIEGGTLRGRIPFGSVDDAVAIAIQVAEALQEAHEHGIVHRDIKADNVMLTSKGQVKVMDFGLAKLKGSLKLTKTSSTVGTLGYMAPEQIQGGEVDHRSDIFSFGVLLFEMLTGKLPFRGEHEAAMVYSIVNEEPADITQLVPELPPIVANLIGRCLEKNPAERYQHFDDVIADLKRSQRKTSKVMASSAHDAGFPGKARAGEKVLWAVATVVAVAIIASGVYLFFPGGGPAEGSARTIAVLPFENMSGTDDAAFSAGITEDILTQISKIGDLRVLSRFTLKEYDSKGKSPVEIGKELGVANLLAGSIRRSGDKLRIGCQLIETGSGREIWAETYDRTIQDVFAIQSEVATEIARTLKAQLSTAEKGRIEHKPTGNTDAYRAYLAGRELYDRYLKDENAKAIGYFRKALELDPRFALPYAGLCDAYAQAVNRYRTLGRAWFDTAKAMGWKAVALDPEAAEGWKALGLVYYGDGRLDSALSLYLKAIEKNPNHAAAVGNIGIIYNIKGQLDEAVRWYRKAIELNPTASLNYTNIASLYVTLGMYSSCERALDRALELPGHDRFNLALARTALFLATGDKDRALKQTDTMLVAADHSTAYELAGILSLYAGDLRLAGGRFRESIRRSPPGIERDPDNIAFVGLGYVLMKEGKSDSAAMLLRRALEVQRKVIAAGDATPANELAAADICGTLGRKEEALDHFSRAVALGAKDSGEYMLDPMLALIRDDPRFRKLLGEIEAKVTEMRKKVEALDAI